MLTGLATKMFLIALDRTIRARNNKHFPRDNCGEISAGLHTQIVAVSMVPIYSDPISAKYYNIHPKSDVSSTVSPKIPKPAFSQSYPKIMQNVTFQNFVFDILCTARNSKVLSLITPIAGCSLCHIQLLY